MPVPVGVPSLSRRRKRQTDVRLYVNDRHRPPDLFLGRGFRPRSGPPSSRTPGSPAAARRAQGPLAHGAVGDGRLPGRAGRLRSLPWMGVAGACQPLCLHPRGAGALAGPDLLAPGGGSPAPAVPRPRRAPSARRALPNHDGRAGQGADGGERGVGAAALPRNLVAGGQGDRGRAATSPGAGHANDGDARTRGDARADRLLVRRLGCSRDSDLADTSGAGWLLDFNASVPCPKRSPSFATLGAQSGFRGSRRIGRQARRSRAALLRSEPAARQRQPPVHEEARGRPPGSRPLHPERHGRAGAGGGPRPPAQEAGPGVRAGEEAADRRPRGPRVARWQR